MAEVFLAKSFGAEGLEKILVIKRILPDISDNRRFVDMFISEAKIAVDLNHPNIVQIYDFGKVDETYFLAMEFVDGADLGEVLSAARKGEKPMSVGDAVFIGTQIAKGLDYAHRRKDRFGEPLNIVHRDVSPQNILISRDGTVKVVDFGIAKASSVADQNPKAVKGKFSYMSPEQARGKDVDNRSDIFSLGVVLFEMLTGRPLFKFTTKDETLSMVKSAVVPDIVSLNPDIPEELIELVYRVLSKDPDERPQTARDLQVELTKILYAMGEFRDSATIASYFHKLEPHLSPDPETESTAIASDLATFRQGTGVVTATGGTMVHTQTPPLTVVADDVTRVAQMQTRERKECVIISGRLQGLFQLRSVLGQDRWFQILQEYTRIVDSIAYKSDAVVHRVNEDGFVILLGVPVSSVNDAETAARVSLDLHEAVAGMNPSLDHPISLSVGIAIGHVILEQEVDKTGRRFSWSFYDSAHELADKMARVGMAREILLGGQVYRRIRKTYDCESVDSLRFQGAEDEETQKIQAYLLSGPKSQTDRIDEVKRAYHGFHGRELPLKAMRERFREAMLDNRSTAVVIKGPTGIGKSTLVEEFLGGLDPRNVRFLRGVVPSYDRDVPLACLATLMAEMMRLGDREDLRQIRTTLSTRVNALFHSEDEAEKDILLHSLGALFGIRFPDSDFELLAADERRHRIFLSVRKLITKFAEKKPIVVVIDDAHYLDSMTLSFVAEYVDEEADVPAILVLTADTVPALESNEWEQLLAQKDVWVEELDELTPTEAKQLITELLRQHRISDADLVDEILRRSGGSPLFIKEVVDVLRDRGVLTNPDERRKLSDGESPNWLPSNVDGLLRSRIDRLELTLKTMLQRVSLLWSPFSGSDADLVLEGEDVPADLHRLVELGFLSRADMPQGATHETYDPFQAPPEKREYRFANALTQEVAARGLVDDEASEIHRKLADHLIDSGGDPSSALIARHFDGAGQTERSVEYYFQAADAAFEQFGAAESLRLVEKVLQRVDHESEMGYQALKIKAKALVQVGGKEETAATLENLEEIAEAQDDPMELADVLLRLARFKFNWSQMRSARELADRVAELAQENDAPLFEARSWLIHTMVDLNEGSRESALERTRKAEEVASGHEDGQSVIVDALNLRGIILRQSGRHSEALEAYERGIELAESAELSQPRRTLLTNAGIALAYLGRFDEAITRYEEALEQSRRLGHRREEAGLLVNLGHAHLLRGAHEEAVKAVRRGNYLARKTNSHPELADGLITMGLIYVERNEHTKAEPSLHEGLRLADSIPNVYLSVHATLLLAQVHLAAGTSDAARIALMQAEDAVERSEGADMVWGVSYGNMLMARALKILGEREKAIKRSQKAVDYVNEGEIYAIEEILYYHFDILPDDEEHAQYRQQAIARAREVIMHRRDMLPDEEARNLFVNRPLNRQILNVSKLIQES